MKRAKPYEALRRAMAVAGVDQPYMAVKISRSLRCLESRINGRSPWTQEEMYAVMELLSLPEKDLHVYFPLNGKETDGTAAVRKPVKRKIMIVEIDGDRLDALFEA